MADKKISELTALTGANVATDDQLVIVDTSAALTKSITIDEFKNALDTATGFVRITGDTMTGNLSMGDNVKAIFGAGSDLQIYHDGASSIIADAGSGNLQIRANDFQLLNAAGSQNIIRGYDATGAVGLHYGGSEKLATTSTGVDITGTLTSDGLTVQANVPDVIIESTNAAGEAWKLRSSYNNTGGSYGSFQVRDEANTIWMRFNQNNGSDEIDLRTTNLDRLNIANNGDISFYEDTGTTPKFFWDASAERVNVGNLYLGEIGSNYDIIQATSSAGLRLQSSGGSVYLDSSGNVGIGTTSPATHGLVDGLVIGDGTSNQGITLFGSTTSQQNIAFTDIAGDQRGLLQYTHSSDAMRFFTSAQEAMRIDSSGNVGIGTDSPLAAGSSYTVLDIGSSSTASLLNMTDNGTETGRIVAQSDQLHLSSGTASGFIGFRTGGFSSGDEAMRIDSSGHVLINNTAYSANGTLVVQQTADSKGIGIIDSAAANTFFLENDGTINKIRNNAAVPIAFETNDTERMRIDSSGGVLIGPSSSGTTQALYVGTLTNGNASVGLKYSHDDRSTLGLQIRTDEAFSSSYPITFSTTGSSDMTLDASGNLLKNTTSTISPGSNTDTGIQLSANNQAIFMASGGPSVLIARNGSVGEVVRFGNQGTGDVGSIDVTTTSTSYNTSSDYRLKENVVDLTSATTRLKQLEPKRFNFIADADTTVDGFLAHEVQSVVPEAISGTHNEVDAEGNPVYQGIDQSKLVPLLVATIKELEARIAALENA